MGLTINYSLRSPAKTSDQATRLVEQMRQLALDLPFEEVGEIVSIDGDDCDFESQRGKVDELRLWLLIQSSQHMKCPWNERSYRSVTPTRIIAFETIPGPGCEAANFGLCQYPSVIEWKYQPTDDARFQEQHQDHKQGWTSWQFSWQKWGGWLRRNGHPGHLSPDNECFAEVRRVKTGLSGWRWSSFCKTQYASNPACGGIPNFLRCHISLVTLLDRISDLPTLQVEINDEGKYGSSTYSDDWQQAKAEGRRPTYSWHEGKYDPKALTAEAGDWNGMVASYAGAFKDAASESGLSCDSAIGNFPNFEVLEFKGSQDKRIEPFLRVMKQIAEDSKPKDDLG